MTTDRELMQQALDALEKDQYDMVPDKEGHMVFRKEVAITALRERLAQPEQEPVATLFGSLHVYDVPPAKPVAWVENLENARPHCVTDLKYCSVAQHERGEHLKYIPLYTVPPQREFIGLTDDDIEKIHYDIKCKGMGAYSTNDIYRAIEAKLKEKNNA